MSHFPISWPWHCSMSVQPTYRVTTFPFLLHCSPQKFSKLLHAALILHQLHRCCTGFINHIPLHFCQGIATMLFLLAITHTLKNHQKWQKTDDESSSSSTSSLEPSTSSSTSSESAVSTLSASKVVDYQIQFPLMHSQPDQGSFDVEDDLNTNADSQADDTNPTSNINVDFTHPISTHIRFNTLKSLVYKSSVASSDSSSSSTSSTSQMSPSAAYQATTAQIQSSPVEPEPHPASFAAGNDMQDDDNHHVDASNPYSNI